MKRFDFMKLPTWALQRIYCYEWNDGEFDDEVLGQCFIRDGWCLDDGSHVFTFTSRKDLLETLKSLEREPIVPLW